MLAFLLPGRVTVGAHGAGAAEAPSGWGRAGVPPGMATAPGMHAHLPGLPASLGRRTPSPHPQEGPQMAPSTQRTCQDSPSRPPSAGTLLEWGHWPFSLRVSKQKSSVGDRGVAGPLQTPLPRSVMAAGVGKASWVHASNRLRFLAGARAAEANYC